MKFGEQMLDIEIAGLEFSTPFWRSAETLLQPSSSVLLESIPRNVADELLAQIREKRTTEFSFKASCEGFSIEANISIGVIGYDAQEDRYYVTLDFL